MANNNSNVNISFVISSIIKTVIFILIIGIGIYLLKSYQPDFYNKNVYSLITGKKVNIVTANTNSSGVIEDNFSSSTPYMNNFDIAEENTEISVSDNSVVVESVTTSSKRKIVIIPEEQTTVVKKEQVVVEVPQSTKSTTPRFIDGYEVITIEDTEPFELSEKTGKASNVQSNRNVQQPQVQQEVVYVEPAIPEDYDGPNWAVVAINTEIYNKEMKKLGSILGGIVVETNGHIFKNNATLIQCFQIKDGVINKDVEFYLKESDLVMFRGPYNTNIHPDKTTVIDFCTIRGKYQKLLDDLRKEELKKNPYFAEYQEHVTKYKKMEQESNELEAKRKTTSGAEKANLEDRIHKLKIEEVSARKNLKDAQRKYESWRNKNLGSGEEIKITPTPELNKLKQQMDALFPRANQICPGI